MDNGMQKLSLKEKIGYSVGDTASNLFFQTFILFLLYFYTEVFGISAAQAGFMFLITRFWDAVNDPMMGVVADRTTSRWGKFRPYLLWAAIPFGVLGVLMFSTPDLSPVGKLVYAYVTYTLMMMVYTIINVPYSALMGVIIPNSVERTVVSSFRFVAAFAGMMIVQFSVLRMVEYFGQGNEIFGWKAAMGILSLLAVILFWITFALTKERVHPIQDQRNPLLEDLGDLVTNKPWLLIGSATVFQLMYVVIRGGCVMYYFQYYIQDQEVSIFGRTAVYSFKEMASAFLMAGTLITILGAILTKWLSRMLGKSKTYAGFLALSGVATALVYVLSPQHLLPLFGLQLITSFALGPVSVLQWAIYTDTADYSEWKTGRRSTGLVMSASLFALKLGIALGGTALAWILAGYGYEANQPQTPQALQGIRLAMTVFAAVPAIIGAAIMLFYPVTNDRMKTIETELAERRRAVQPAADRKLGEFV